MSELVFLDQLVWRVSDLLPGNRDRLRVDVVTELRAWASQWSTSSPSQSGWVTSGSRSTATAPLPGSAQLPLGALDDYIKGHWMPDSWQSERDGLAMLAYLRTEPEIAHHGVELERLLGRRFAALLEERDGLVERLAEAELLLELANVELRLGDRS